MVEGGDINTVVDVAAPDDGGALEVGLEWASHGDITCGPIGDGGGHRSDPG
jgi:hypothetical protein